MPGQLPGCFQLSRTVGQSEANRLMIEDRRAKTLAVFGIGQRHLKRAARHADTLRGNADAPTFQAAQRNAVAFALAANQALYRHAAVVKVDLRSVAGVLPELVFKPRHVVTR